MKMLFRLACAMALLFAPAAQAQTGSSVQFPAGWASGQSVCVKQANGTCVPVAATMPLPTAATEPLPLYTATATAYTAYATPTDLLTITAPTGKRVVVRDMRLLGSATAATLVTFQYLTRSTANTGGTATTLTAMKRDNLDAAATAVVRLYTAAPTTGTLDRALTDLRLQLTATTSAPALVAPSNVGSAVGSLFTGVPIAGIVLNPGETMALGFGGAALPAGFTASVGVVWTEEAL